MNNFPFLYFSSSTSVLTTQGKLLMFFGRSHRKWHYRHFSPTGGTHLFTAFVCCPVTVKDYFSTMESDRLWSSNKWSCCSNPVLLHCICVLCSCGLSMCPSYPQNLKVSHLSFCDTQVCLRVLVVHSQYPR